jgi:hypothetical protein
MNTRYIWLYNFGIALAACVVGLWDGRTMEAVWAGIAAINALGAYVAGGAFDSPLRKR